MNIWYIYVCMYEIEWVSALSFGGKSQHGNGVTPLQGCAKLLQEKGTFLSRERQLLQNLATCAWGPRGLFQYKDVKKEEEKERSVMLRFFCACGVSKHFDFIFNDYLRILSSCSEARRCGHFSWRWMEIQEACSHCSMPILEPSSLLFWP